MDMSLRFWRVPTRLVWWFKTTLKNTLMMVICLLLLAQSSLPPANPYERIRTFTRNDEFDYLDWTLDALLLKFAHGSLDLPRHLSVAEQREAVMDYIKLVAWINKTSLAINRIYADPAISDKPGAAAELSQRLEILRSMEKSQKPIAEEILQYQVSVIVGEIGLGTAGQPLPPVMYHATSLPNALIISPRDVIRQDYNISLLPEMTIEQIVNLEHSVEEELNVSALVVPVGGVGTYPTMVLNSTNLPWLLEVIAHEWIHNYLTLRPLGINYLTSPELRTMNETTANIAGKEIGWAALERFYPEIAAQLTPPEIPTGEEPEEPEQPAAPTPTPEPEDPTIFRFGREMHKTRVRVDELLAQGKIEEAEAYMEQRRQVFWEQGYRIRRLNQAYFAFYGAYADTPGGGAAGRDPVGPAVQRLRHRSASLTEFIRRIAGLTSFEQLQQLVQ